MNGARLHSHAPTHASIYLGVLSLQVQNFIRRVNSTPTLQQVCSVALFQIIHLQLQALSWVSFHKNPVYYKVFGSKHISVGEAQMHLSSANAKQWSRLNISQKMLEHDEKMYFKNIVSNAINEDLKNMFARLYDIFCF